MIQYKIPVPIDICNQAIQASNAMEVANVESLLSQIVSLRDNWQAKWNETELVASGLQFEVKLSRATIRKRIKIHDRADEQMFDENVKEAYCRKHIFYVILVGKTKLCLKTNRREKY